MQNQNKNVLQKIWEKQKSLQLGMGTEGKSKNQHQWSKLLFFTLGSIAEYLVRADNASSFNTDVIIKNQLEFSGKYLELITDFSEPNNPFSKDPELKLFSAVAYYFGGYPGAAVLVAEKINTATFTLLEKTLFEVLMVGQKRTYIPTQFISTKLDRFLSGQDTIEELYLAIKRLKEREAFFDNDTDYLAFESAIEIVRLKISNSVITNMPNFSNTEAQKWRQWLTAGKLFPLMWESQKKIGNAGVYSGKSAVIQMPTGVGKTAAMSLIIRSAIASKRLHLAIIVAPFKSIRDEIFRHLSNEFSKSEVSLNRISEDLIENFKDFKPQSKPSIFIVTPEKLLFMLSHNQEELSEISMVIYDEAHQMDNGVRGITFELLLTTINILISPNTQQLFMSAVVGNPKTISEWFNSGKSTEISGLAKRKYSQTYGLAFWNKDLDSGTIEINPNISDQQGWISFDNVVNKVRLSSRKVVPKYPETKNKSDQKNDSTKTNDANRWFSVLLAEKFLREGMVAVFFVQKRSLLKASESFTQFINSSTELSELLNSSTSTDSLDRLANLLIKNFGPNSRTAKAYKNRVIIHDGDVPEGIRNAVEYEAKKNNVPLLLCTTTLAQGVNIPIQTMIIFSSGNKVVKLRDRDLQNLIGRVGRPGISNEGNVVFMNGSSEFTLRRNLKLINDIIEELPIEKMGSSLLNIFKDEKENPYEYNSEVVKVSDWLNDDFLQDPNNWITQHIEQKNYARRNIFQQRADTIFKIESFLMSLFDIIEDGDQVENLRHIVEGTFASFVSDDTNTKNQLFMLFNMLLKKISALKIPTEKIKQYGRTLKGVNDASIISNWVAENATGMLKSSDISEWILELWPILRKSLTYKQTLDESFYQQMLVHWVKGDSYAELLALWSSEYPQVKISQGRETVEKVFQFCSSCFQFEMSTMVPSIAEFVTDAEQRSRLEYLQCAIRIGLQDTLAQQIYILGINDRYLATAIAKVIPNGEASTDQELRFWLRNNLTIGMKNLNSFIPDYYSEFIRKL